jgi:hypothetical protein
MRQGPELRHRLITRKANRQYINVKVDFSPISGGVENPDEEPAGPGFRPMAEPGAAPKDRRQTSIPREIRKMVRATPDRLTARKAAAR